MRSKKGIHMMKSLRQSVDYVHCLVEDIMHVTEDNLGGSASAVLLIDGDHQELRFEFVHGPIEKMLKGATIGMETGLEGWVTQHGKPLVVNDVSEDGRFCKELDEITGFVTRSVICVPLFSQRRIVGVMDVINKSDGRGFNEQDLQTLLAVSSTTAKAVQLKLAGDTVLASVEEYQNLVGNLTARELQLLNVNDYQMAGALIDRAYPGPPAGSQKDPESDNANRSGEAVNVDRLTETVSVEARRRTADIIAEADDMARRRRQVILGWGGVNNPGL